MDSRRAVTAVAALALGGDAMVSMADRTYEITGTAKGFATAKPSIGASGTFSVKVSC